LIFFEKYDKETGELAIHHAVMVSSVDGSNFYFTANSTDRMDHPLFDAFVGDWTALYVVKINDYFLV
jgi:hypothetical protein